MRPISSSNQTLLNEAASGKRIKVLAYVDVWDRAGASSTRITEIQKMSVKKSRSAPTATASVEFFTRMTGSTSPLLNAAKPIEYGSRIELWYEYTDNVGNNSRWQWVFKGYVEEFVTLGENTMVVQCTDLMGRIMKRFTEYPKKYGAGGGRQLHLVLQDLLDDWYPGVTLDTPHGTPSYLVKEEEFSEASLGQLMRDLALRIGWDVEHRWKDDGSTYGNWYVSLIDPGRSNTTATYTFTSGYYRAVPDIGLRGQRVRNKVQIPYIENGARGFAVAQASGPDLTFEGTLFTRLGENQSFKFTSQATAQTAADLALADLRYPDLAASYSLPPFYFAELDDCCNFDPPAQPLRQYNTQQKLYVTEFEHTWELNQNGAIARTLLGVRGKPTAGSERWAEHYSPVIGPGLGDATAPNAITGLTGDFTTPNAILSWNGVENAIGYKVTLTTLGATRRIDYPTSPYYEYTLEANKTDHVNPVAVLGFEVRSLKMVEGAQLPSSPVVLALTNLVPAAPTSLVVQSRINHIIVSMAQPTFGDYLETQVEVSLAANFSSLHERYIGTAYAGIRLSVATTGLHYVRARYVDIFNQASSWTTGQVEAQLIDGSQIGSISFAQLLGQILEGQIGPNVISTDAIKAEAIVARHLGVGDTVNSFPDARMVDMGNWNLDSRWSRSTTAGVNYFNQSALLSSSVDADHDAYTPYFDVLPNTPYAMSFLCAFGGTGTVEVYWTDDTTTALIGSFTQAATLLGGTFTTPFSNKIRLKIRRKSGGTSLLSFGNIVVTRRFGGNFIVDGDVVVSRDINAGGVIRAGTPSSYRADLVAGGLKVYDGTNTQRVGLGDISGKAWGSGTLASNTWGLWGGRNAGVYLADYPVVVVGYATSTNISASFTAGEVKNISATLGEYTLSAAYTFANGRYAFPSISIHRLMSDWDGNVVGDNDSTIIGINSLNLEARRTSDSTWISIYGQTDVTIDKLRATADIRVKNNSGSTQTVQYLVSLRVTLLDMHTAA